MRLTVSGRVVLLPRDLLGEHGVDVLGAGAPAPDPHGGLLRFAEQLDGGVLDDADVTALRRAGIRLLWRQLRTVIVLLAAGSLLAFVDAGPVLGGALLVVLLVVVGLSPRQVLSPRAMPGRGDVMRVGVDGDRWVIASATAVSALPMAALTGVVERDDVLQLSGGSRKRLTAGPRRLVPTGPSTGCGPTTHEAAAPACGTTTLLRNADLAEMSRSGVVRPRRSAVVE